MGSWKEKVVVITGSSAGIGAATAVAFAKKGCRLVIHGRNPDKLQAVADRCFEQEIKKEDASKIFKIKARVVQVVGNLKDDSTVEAIIKSTLDTFGTIHVLINNAGYVSPHEGMINKGGSVEGMDDMYRINIRVPYMLIQAFIPELSKNKGNIVNTSSGYSTVADPKMIGYCTSKAGLDHMTKCLALGLGMKGIRVNSINPGYVRTDVIKPILGEEGSQQFFEYQDTLSPVERKLATPEDIANCMVFLASDEGAAISGTNLLCDRATSLSGPFTALDDYI